MIIVHDHTLGEISPVQVQDWAHGATRPGQWALVIGVEMITLKPGIDQVALKVRWPDGIEEHWQLDRPTYRWARA